MEKITVKESKMKELKKSDGGVNKKIVRKALLTIILCIIMIIAFNYNLPIPNILSRLIKILSTAGLIYVLVSFKMED